MSDFPVHSTSFIEYFIFIGNWWKMHWRETTPKIFDSNQPWRISIYSTKTWNITEPRSINDNFPLNSFTLTSSSPCYSSMMSGIITSSNRELIHIQCQFHGYQEFPMRDERQNDNSKEDFPRRILFWKYFDGKVKQATNSNPQREIFGKKIQNCSSLFSHLKMWTKTRNSKQNWMQHACMHALSIVPT